LSAASLNEDDFLPFVRTQFESFGVPYEAVCFEITETAAIASFTRATRFIHELKMLGCGFSLDDFGSGMSSFGYLKHLPVDHLKIDGVFIRDIARDPVDRAMVEAINKVGRVMGITTIAECVESVETLAILQVIGVDYAQGFGIARPRAFIMPHRSALSVVTDEGNISFGRA
ncbi:MAG: EAL domain-containing protein, partial [Betaproteobacteria bacterium]